jgi:hypothetical protein
MNMNEIRTIAKDRGINATKLRKAELIRAIQSDEHNSPCFATDHVRCCGQTNCLWLADCEKAISIN